jgi:hypothetical protein
MSPAGHQLVTRRQFLSEVLGASALLSPRRMLGAASLGGFAEVCPRGKSIVLLWMAGGPSTVDLWDLKPGAATSGPFRPISTSGEGRICEHLPMLARQMHHLAVIRSMSTFETDHDRARCFLRSGHLPGPDPTSPDDGQWWAHRLVDSYARRAVPTSVTLGNRTITARAPGRLPWTVVGLEGEPTTVRRRYGESDFGRGCLVARRFVEQQVPLIEICFSGWDHHRGIFAALKDRQLPIMDRAMSALVEDLDQRGLLPDTLLVWMGEFGRTPRINGEAGRDHWARAWSVVLGGARIRGGTVIGQTSRDGRDVVSEPYSAEDLRATIGAAIGASPPPMRCAGDTGMLRKAGRGQVIAAALI